MWRKVIMQRQRRRQELGGEAADSLDTICLPLTALTAFCPRGPSWTFKPILRQGRLSETWSADNRRIADLQQSALNKMQKDSVSGQLPRMVLWELQGEPQGRPRVQITVCFFRRWEGSTCAWCWRKADLQWIPLRHIYPCKNTSSGCCSVIPPKQEQGAATRQRLLPRLQLLTCQARWGKATVGERSSCLWKAWGLLSRWLRKGPPKSNRTRVHPVDPVRRAVVESLCLKWYRSATGREAGGSQAPCERSFSGEGPRDGAVPEPRPFPSVGTAGNCPAVRVAGGILPAKCGTLEVTAACR